MCVHVCVCVCVCVCVYVCMCCGINHISKGSVHLTRNRLILRSRDFRRAYNICIHTGLHIFCKYRRVAETSCEPLCGRKWDSQPIKPLRAVPRGIAML